MKSSNILFLFIFIVCSCENKTQKNSRPRKTDLVELTYDSVMNGLRDQYIYDPEGKIITREKAESLLLTGEYEAQKKAIMDMQLHRITNEEFELLEKQKPNSSMQFPPQSVFPNFKAVDITGKSLSNKNFKGKILVINFWFLACTPCRAEMKDLNKIVDKYAGKDVNFISFTPDKKDQIIKAWAKLNFNYKIIPDQEALITAIHIDAFPTHVVVDESGKVVFSCSDSGPHVINWLNKILDSCLAASN